MKTILILGAATVLAHGACVTVASPEIAAGDLADAVPALRSLDPAIQLGFAPLPGTQRIFTARQLNQFLRQYGLWNIFDSAIPDICIERVTYALSSADIKAALVSALGLAGADIEVIDFARQPLPPGRLEFDRANLNRPPEASPNSAVIWRGRLRYDWQRSMSVWAKVRISVDSPRLIATGNISAGAVIHSDDFRLVTGRHFPDWGPVLSSSEAAIGKLARRNISLGQRLVPDMLGDPPDIEKGGKVHVKVLEGGASLSLDAVAQSAGKRGDTILIHNPASGRNFRAVVVDRGEALVRPGEL